MKTIIYKMSSNRILGFLMAFAVMFFTYNAKAQCNVQVTATVVNATSATASDGSIIAMLNNGTSGAPTCQATVAFSNGVTSAGYGGMTFTNPNLSPGTYTVISTDCQGCTDTAIVTVGVTAPQNCVASGAMCPCPMIYMPVCGCDGVLYSNDCIANCQGVSYTPAIPDGMGGFLPCTVSSTPGCTDPMASNYDPTATVDDGSCLYPGCMDTLASNYCATCNVSDSTLCVYQTVGCMDSLATNYCATCNVSDSTLCVYANCTMTASITTTDESCAAACDGVVSANVSSSACISLDTIIPGTHLSNYNSTMVRGYYFQAQSSFVISYLRASDGNPQVTNSQSVAIVDYGTTAPVAYPATTGSHTTLFSAVDAGTGWIACNVNIVAGNYYAVLGAKHNSGNTTMYNSYGAGATVLNLDGIPTTVNRVVLQTVIPVGGPASGTVMSNAAGSIGRVDLITGITSPGAVSYLWSTGDTTQSVDSLCVGTYSVTITDCQGCVSSATATLGTAIVSGCTDSTASNFDPCAVIDDGSCLVACPSGIGANSESFEDPAVPLNAQGPWANWTYDVASSTFTSTNGWRKDNLGTGSTGTGPLNGAPSFDGAYYLYCETSGGGVNAVANLHSACVDLNNFTNPAFAFAYNMYGATMGTLNVDVSNDGGATWNNMWTESGDQGQPWYEAGIPLSAYAGQIIQVRMSYTSGTSFTGDCAIDYLRFIDGLNIGCMDSTACNYDSTATIGATCDYTCLGCTDPLATNYDSTATVDDGSCAYPCTPYISGVSIIVDNDASCNGGSDGQASAVVASSNGNDYYLWSTGATTSTVTGLSAGTYTCTVTDSVYGCVATVSVVISEPLAVTVTGTTIDAMPGQNNGQASITVSGGIPCTVSDSLVTHNPLHTSNGSSGVHFNIINNSPTDLTINAFSQGSYQYSGANNISVYYMPAPYVVTPTGWTQVANAVPVTIPVGATFTAPLYSTPVAITPVTIPAGATYGFYVGGTSSVSYATATATGVAGSVVASNALISVTSGVGGVFGSGTFNPRAPVLQVHYGDPNASPYTYSWTNGDTTQNVTGLPLGPIGVTVTDCNGCTGNWMGFILTNTLPGCTDPTAFNYNPLANLDDSSCIPVILGCIDSLNLISGMPNVNYNSLANTDDGSCTDTLLGCTDSLAANYNMYANVDDGSCIVACPTGIGANQDGFETATGTTQQGPWNHWTLDATTNTFTLTNAWRSWTGSTGSTNTGPTAAAEGTYYLYCETSGQSNKTASLVSECVDLANFASPTFVASYHMYGATMGILNIDISNDGGWTWTNLWTESGDQGNQWYDAVIDLSAYAGQIVQVRMNYTSGSSFTGDCAIDNLRFMEAPMSGCMDPLACNYDSNATISDGSCYVLTGTVTTTDITCNGLTDGTATVSANAPLASYVWSNGATTATTTGLAVGTYTCVVVDSLGCVDSVSASISEPNPISLSMTIGNESSAGAGDGQIDLSVSGGVPCATNVQVGSGTVSSFQSYLWYTFYMDGHTEITYPASELAALGMNAGDVMDELGWKILTLGSGYTMNNAQMTVNGVVVYTGNYTPVAGMNNFVFSTPVTYTGGDVVVTWCFDNAAYVSGNNMFESTMISGTLSNYSDLSTASGCTAITPTLARTYRPNAYIGFASASGYTYNWSNGDTTEDVTNLTSGTYCVTVTDCNGCISSLCDSVGISATLGCTDPTAMNYNSFANQDDGSCMYDCSVFAISLDSMGNVTGCNGGSNGYVVASINMSGSVTWLDNGSTVANRSNMSAGTYSLVAVTPDGLCYDTLNVTISEPSAINLSMAIGNESAVGAADGQIDLTVSGGTACYTGSPILITEYDPGAPDALEIQNVSGSDLDVTGWTVHVSGSYTDINNTNPTVQTLSGIMTAGATQYWTDGSVNPWGSNLFWNPGAITSFRGWIMIKDASGTVMDVFIANWNATEIAASTVGLAGMWVGDGWNQTTVPAGNSASRIAAGNDATVFTNAVSTLGVTNSGLILPFSSAGAYTYVWSSGDSTEDVSNLTAGVYCVTVTDCNGCTASLCDTIIVATTPGCTDPLASNYNSFATVDDGSCLYPGCTDTTALNYDPNANIDDGSCILPCSVIAPVCEDFSFGVVPLGACPQVGGWSTSVVSGDGWRFTGTPGYQAASNGRPAGTYAWIDFSATDVGVVMQMDPVDVSGLSNPTLTFDYFSDIGTYVLPVANIMHIEAYNGASWDSVATFQEFTTGWVSKSVDVSTYAVAGVVTLRFRGESSGQGSDFYNDLLVDNVCVEEGQIVVVSGCTDSTATNYNSLATVDDGSCVYPAIPGCTDSTAFNYNPLATIDDSSCVPVQLGCLDPSALNYNSNANTDDGSCVYAGCTDSTACNYDPNATVDDGSCIVAGCTDSTASNYNPNAGCDDGSCNYPPAVCTEDAPTNLSATDIIQSRATINWDNMNSSVCLVDQYRIKFRPVGSSSWTQKTMGQPVGSCLWAANNTSKLILNLLPNTQYEYQMKAWYCGGSASAWTALHYFTTMPDCPNVGNLAVTTPLPTRATFTWDDSNGTYSFVRIKSRVDTANSVWFNVGGLGVAHGIFTKNKNNLEPGQSYRGQARTWCSPNGGAYKSPTWTSLLFWTQPTQRLEVGTAISNLDVYPNPSRDMFNVTFTSEDVQDLEVRVINVVGEVVYTESLQQYVGEYTKQIDLAKYTKGVYFLEITTDNGVVNKKLILQ